MRTLFIVFALLVAPSLAEAQSGVQWTRDRDATLVNKDVEGERWAITYRLADGRVTGNVFRTAGPPAFLDCDRTSVTDRDATFTCFGADACAFGIDEMIYQLYQLGNNIVTIAFVC